MALVALGVDNGSWQALKAQWRDECARYDEEFEGYAVATFSVLDPLAELGHPKSGVYGFYVNEDCQMICEANRTMLPGYVGYVLRVRNMTFAPKFDFEDQPVNTYGNALVGLFGGILGLSNSEATPHIKFHLRSPADRTFFHALCEPLLRIPIFDTVEVRGAWLYVTKKQ
jgi:hypothetical protein